MTTNNFIESYLTNINLIRKAIRNTLSLVVKKIVDDAIFIEMFKILSKLWINYEIKITKKNINQYEIYT
ncbi:hypothetical protein BpHYR1_008834 [Brachionus plicatilis]|uniref:Uncharacterized protein n=1 Tax=Brachionus plicatilis TaxID=10195 RepID=A0A3M7R782_BRAPC|nr:hypothetical protein BpHYR1_008834 [Brachionus plicatilis]